MHSYPRGMAKGDQSKHEEVAFQLAAADFGSNSLWQTSYLKDIVGCAYYNSITRRVGLKQVQRCVKVKKNWVNINFN